MPRKKEQQNEIVFLELIDELSTKAWLKWAKDEEKKRRTKKKAKSAKKKDQKKR